MGATTKIEWADRTFNGWEGCTKVSAACTNCYAEERDKRWHDGDHWGPGSVRKSMSENYWRQPYKWDREARLLGRQLRVFCMSLGDVFERLPGDHPSARMQFETRLRLWETIKATPNLIWMLLTKRIENAKDLLPWGGAYIPWRPAWPNVWIGATMENQAELEGRFNTLVDVPAVVRFISYEPALGPIKLPEFAGGVIDWIIMGDESGPRRRPAKEEWFRQVRDQCNDSNIALFYKQRHVSGVKVSLPLLDGKRYVEFPEPVDVT